jgi:hypothetical protein
MPTERRAGVACVAALVVCILWVHWPGLAGPAHLTAHHDNLDGAAPLRVEAARQWRSGAVPLWNPWKRSGMPLLADTTAGALYPGNAPFLFSDFDPAPAEDDSRVFRALDQVAAINAVLAGVFLYVFLRTIALAPLASAFGGLVFACCGTMGWFAAWYVQIQSSVIWLPLLLAAVHRASGAAAARWTTIGAAAVALQFFAGFPETSFYSGVIAIAWAIHLAVARGSARPVVAVVSIYAAGCLLAAVQLLPSLELQSLSRRPAELPLDVFQSAPATTAMFRAWLAPPPAWAFEFPPLAAYHFGAVATLAAIAGAVAFLRKSAFFVVLLAVGVALSLGAATPLSALLHQLPGFHAFRHPFKHMFEVMFAMSVLAALGAQWVAGRRDAPASPLRLAAIGFAIAATCVLLRANQAAIIAANPAATETSGARPSMVQHIEPGWRVLTPRQVFQRRDPEFLVGDYPSGFEIPAIHGAGPFLWADMAEATGMIEEETTFRPGLFSGRDRTLALLSGRYLLQTIYKQRFIPGVDAAAWRVVSETSEARLLEQRNALPRVRFAGSVRCATDTEVRASLDGSTESPAEVALVDCVSQPAPQGPFHLPSSLELEITHEAPGSLVIETNIPQGASAFLVVSQSDFPGWHAGVDGRRADIRRVHGLVQGIELPSGTKRVDLRYMPLAFLAGTAMSAATLIVLLLWCVVTWPWKDDPAPAGIAAPRK